MATYEMESNKTFLRCCNADAIDVLELDSPYIYPVKGNHWHQDGIKVGVCNTYEALKIGDKEIRGADLQALIKDLYNSRLIVNREGLCYLAIQGVTVVPLDTEYYRQFDLFSWSNYGEEGETRLNTRWWRRDILDGRPLDLTQPTPRTSGGGHHDQDSELLKEKLREKEKELEEEKRKHEEDVKELRRKLTKWEEELKKQKEELEASRSENKELKEEVKEVKHITSEKLKKSEEELKKHKEQLDSTRSENKELKEEVKEVKQITSEKLEKSEDESKKNKEELRATRSENKELKEQLIVFTTGGIHETIEYFRHLLERSVPVNFEIKTDGAYIGKTNGINSTRTKNNRFPILIPVRVEPDIPKKTIYCGRYNGRANDDLDFMNWRAMSALYVNENSVRRVVYYSGNKFQLTMDDGSQSPYIPCHPDLFPTFIGFTVSLIIGVGVKVFAFV